MKTKKLISLIMLFLLLSLQLMAQKVTIEDTTKPKARIYHNLIYHAKTDCFLLFAGFTKHGWQADLRDIWKYDPKTTKWTEAGICEAVPEDRSSGITSMAYDDKSNQFITIDIKGRTWSYNFEKKQWKNLEPIHSPSGRGGQGMVYDKESDKIIMFGGFGARNIDDTVFSETWAYDYKTNIWTKMKPKISPSARMYFAMTYDDLNDKVILWGGRAKNPITDNRIWVYNYNTDTWEPKENNGGPKIPLTYISMVYRSKDKDNLLFGGAVLDSVFKGRPTNVTWTYNLKQNKWNKLSPTISPEPLANQSMSYDSKRNNILLFGGETQALYSNILSDGLWLFDPNQNTWIRK